MNENIVLKPAQVHALPAKEMGDFYNALIRDSEGSYFITSDSRNSLRGGMWNSNDWKEYTIYDLYLTDDSEIKEGDWCINKNGDTLYQIKTVSTYHDDRNDWSKVIATTNKELWTKAIEYAIGEHMYLPLIPKIPLSFIEGFVKEQGKIKEVMVEYEYLSCGFENIKQNILHYLGKSLCTCDMNNKPCNSCYKIKLKSDGSVIIHPFKERVYTEEEVVEYAQYYHHKNPALRVYLYPSEYLDQKV